LKSKVTIPFNIPYTTGKEVDYIQLAIKSGHLSGNGPFTRRCQAFFEERYGILKSLLTTSCTDALEMAAMLINIQPGDEVIVPSFTFVSTALAFHRQGAKIRFLDSGQDHPGLDELAIESLINERTKAIVPVHYAGVACNMEVIMSIAEKYGLYVIEDAAHSIESKFNDKYLGTIGHLGCFSFHETKGIHCGEGGLLAINDKSLTERAEIIWEKGTNRAQFFRGEAAFYEWKDTGSSFLSSELNAAFLYSQIESLERIQGKRIHIWQRYYEGLKTVAEKEYIVLPKIPEYATVNGSIFYLLCRTQQQKADFIVFLGTAGINCLSHYFPLHKSHFYSGLHDGRKLPNSEHYFDTLVRFPIYSGLEDDQLEEIIDLATSFFENE